MRIFSVLSGLLLAGSAVAQSSGSCSPQSSDAEVVEYAWAIQSLLSGFYSSQPLNETFFSGATNSSRAEYAQNLRGIQRQNRLGVRAIQQVATKVPGFSSPSCSFSFPSSSSGEEYVKNALRLEADASSALLGATGYTQSPEVSFILARLAAQHTAHATWLKTQQSGVVFPSNSSSLLPAYNPQFVLGTGDQSGRLGQFLGDCVTAPSSPCGQPFFIGPLVGSVGNQSSAALGPGPAPSGSASLSASPSASLTPTSAAVSPTAAAKRRFSS